MKQKEESSKNGVVGRMGKNIPIIPSVNDNKPMIISIYFLINFIMSP